MHLTEDIAIDRSEEEPKLYAKTLVDLVPDNPEDGPGIPAGSIVEVLEINNSITGSKRFVAVWNGINMDVDLDELDPDC